MSEIYDLGALAFQDVELIRKTVADYLIKAANSSIDDLPAEERQAITRTHRRGQAIIARCQDVVDAARALIPPAGSWTTPTKFRATECCTG